MKIRHNTIGLKDDKRWEPGTVLDWDDADAKVFLDAGVATRVREPGQRLPGTETASRAPAETATKRKRAKSAKAEGDDAAQPSED